MATEAPFQSHTQCTAAADYSSSGSQVGPNTTGQFLCVKVNATRSVAVTSASTDVVHGILQNDPKAGQAAQVVYNGVSKAMAGASFSAGVRLMSDTLGRVITAGATTTNSVLGVAIESATATGQIVTILVSPAAGALA